MAVFGDTLRQARAYKGVTLREAEQATRINRHHLAALEDENFAVLPPLIYQRGIVRNYATYLELDPGKLLAMFDEARGGEATVDLVAAVKPLDMPTHWAPNFAIIAFMVVISAIVFAWAYSAFYAPGEGVATVPPEIPTVTPIPPNELVLPTATPPDSSPAAAATATPRVIATRPSATSTPLPTATTAPSPTPTPQPAVEAPVEAPVEVVQSEQVAPAQEEPPPATGDVLTVSFTATDWLYLSVTVDGVLLFAQDLGPGASTGPLSGQRFEVYTSSLGATSISVNGGDPFVMGWDAVEGSFTLP